LKRRKERKRGITETRFFALESDVEGSSDPFFFQEGKGGGKREVFRLYPVHSFEKGKGKRKEAERQSGLLLFP